MENNYSLVESFNRNNQVEKIATKLRQLANIVNLKSNIEKGDFCWNFCVELFVNLQIPVGFIKQFYVQC